jgi:hypothetical protein
MICLLIMIRVPRPLPKITPNLLLHDPPMMAEQSLRGSIHSVNSATGLLRHEASVGTARRVSSASSGSGTRRYYVANKTPRISPSVLSPTSEIYSAYGSIESNTPTRAVIGLPSSVRSPYSPSLQARRQSTIHSAPQPGRPSPLPNPFDDPLPRNGSPESFISDSLTFSTEHSTTHSSWTTGLSSMEKFQPLIASPPTTSPTYAHTLTESPEGMYFSSLQGPPAQHLLMPPMRSATAQTLRSHTSTPHSVHSVAPSILCHDGHTAAVSATLSQPVHARSPSEPVWRPSSAASMHPHLSRQRAGIHPFPMVGTEVRRFGSVHEAQMYSGGQGGTYISPRNATHLAGALGRTPPRAEAAVASQQEWRQLVLTAATGRSVV